MIKRRFSYIFAVCMCVLLCSLERTYAGVLEISPLRQVASIEQVADSSCPQDFFKVFCTGLVSGATCEMCKPCMSDTMPDYYCDCLDGVPFHYGLDTIISDTIWYMARVSDVINNGMSAYWFSDSVVSIDLFISCNLKSPNRQISLSKNSSRIMSPDDIRSLLGNSGELGTLLGNKPVYIRVAPRARGRVILQKYGESFPSICGDSIFPVYYGIQYGVGSKHAVFHMPRSKTSGLKFINWIQKDNKPVTMNIVRGDCLSGDTIAQVVLSDSVRPYLANSELLNEIYKAKDSLYFAFDAEAFGKVIFRNTAKYPDELKSVSDTVLCQGAIFENGAMVLTDTVFVDTLWVNRDTLALKTTNVSMALPDPVFDTMLLKSNQLHFIYHGRPINNFGDYDITEHIEGGCDVRYMLHVEHDWTVVNKKQTITECSGKTVTINGVDYTKNNTLVDTVVNNSTDTKTVTTYTIEFTSPTLEYDTIWLNKTQLPYKYEGKYVRSFGDTTMTITKRNDCTREIRLTVIETKLPLQHRYSTVDTTICVGMGLALMVSDTLVTVAGEYADSVMIAEDTMLCVVYKLSVAPIDTVADTLRVMKRDMPLQYADTLIGEYGNYGIYVADDDTCHRFVNLVVEPEVEYIILVPVDTVLCHGKAFDLAGELYYENTIHTDTVSLDDYVYGVRTYNLRFEQPEPVEVLLKAKESDLPVAYADTLLGYGTYSIFHSGNGDCDELLQIEVVAEDEYLMLQKDTTVCHGKTITVGGIAYKRDTIVVDTVQLSEHTWQCTAYRLLFSVPELQYDTLSVPTEGLPVTYADTTIADYGTYRVILTAPGECDMLVELEVVQSTGVESVRQELQIVPTFAQVGQLIKVTLPEQGTLQVYDMLGREIMQESLPQGVMPIRLNVEGNYIVQLSTDNSVYTRRIVITK